MLRNHFVHEIKDINRCRLSLHLASTGIGEDVGANHHCNSQLPLIQANVTAAFWSAMVTFTVTTNVTAWCLIQAM
jgi:hypothetical protein